jgi:hypothetical protein
MAEQRDLANDTLENTRPRANEDSGLEHDRVRMSNDRDQELEREGRPSNHNRGYDEAVSGESRGGDIEVVRGELRGQDLGDLDDEALDPDSAQAGNDRDDTNE